MVLLYHFPKEMSNLESIETRCNKVDTVRSGGCLQHCGRAQMAGRACLETAGAMEATCEHTVPFAARLPPRSGSYDANEQDKFAGGVGL